MIHFTCTNCTADLSAEDSQRFITCGWCRRQIEVPRLTKIELDSFTRANRQRQNKQFAEAEKNYQLVLNAHPQDHEALWGLVLCHYGIVYVEDKGDVLPTCWICRPQPILEHPDFKDACELAPAEIRAQRKRDGQYICKAQQDIRHLSETMQPYDIFLCYKHSVIGNPDALTEDSQLANDLCLMLSKEGYRVFYAPVDTKGRAGENYESLIYHALKTAKVMLTISTRPDHLLCSWPQSEWSRFIYMMNQGEDKHLIPLYKHMRVSALPDAFLNRGWQALDMASISFANDLIGNLRRYIPRSAPSGKPAAPAAATPPPEPQAAHLRTAATLFAKPDASSQVLTQMPVNAALLALNSMCAANGAYWYRVQVGMDIGYVIYGAVKLGEAPVATKAETPVAADEHAAAMKAEEQRRLALEEKLREAEQQRLADEKRRRELEDALSRVRADQEAKRLEAERQQLDSASHKAETKPLENAQKSAKTSDPSPACLLYQVSADGTVTITGHTEQIAKVSKLAIPQQIEGKSVTAIGKDAFKNCTHLTEISIAGSITSIGCYAFRGCTGLTSISIPNTGTTLNDNAFYGCSNLTRVYMPDKVKYIAYYAFSGCPSVTICAPAGSYPIRYAKEHSIPYKELGTPAAVPQAPKKDAEKPVLKDETPASFLKYSVSADGTVTITGHTEQIAKVSKLDIPRQIEGKSVTYIGKEAFWNCTSLTSISIPDSVTSIGKEAFRHCNSLTSTSIPDSVTTIGDAAFSYCTSLTSISIPDSVTSIGDGTFEDCTSLIRISIPDSVTSIGSEAFRNCTSLTSISIPDSVTSIGAWAFGGCTTLTIHAPYGSHAINYAKANSFPYKELGTPDAPPKPTATYPLLVRGYMFNIQAPPSSDTPDSLTPAFKQKMRDAFRLNASTEILYASGLFGLAYINNPYARYYFTSSGVIFPRLGFLATLETKNALKLTWKEFMTAAIEDTTILKLHYIKINGQTVHAAGPFGGAGTKANVDKWLAFYHGLQDYLRKNAHLIEQ